VASEADEESARREAAAMSDDNFSSGTPTEATRPGAVAAASGTGGLSVRKAPLHFVGDSHIDYLRDASKYGYFTGREITTCCVGGATAVGMRNPKSQTNALATFRKSLENLDRATIIIIQLGEVDCGFVIWYRAKKYFETVDQQLAESISSHLDFAKSVLDMGFKRVILTSATLPTIKDDHPWGEIADLRREIATPIADRTALTHQYNAALRAGAARLGMGYADIGAAVLDPVTGIIRDDFRHPNPKNHHIHPVEGPKVWGAYLTPEIERLERSVAADVAEAIAPPTANSDREWIANVETCLKSTDGSARNLPDSEIHRVKAGTRVSASLIGEVKTCWWIDTVSVDNIRLERPTWFLDMADWTLLPAHYRDNPALRGGAGAAALTAARLIGRSWSFGPLDDKPYSTAYVFSPDGKIGGNSGPNHKFWKIVEGRLLMFTADHRLTFISEVIREEAGRLRLAGFRLLRPRSTLYGVVSENHGPDQPAGSAAPDENGDQPAGHPSDSRQPDGMTVNPDFAMTS